MSELGKSQHNQPLHQRLTHDRPQDREEIDGRDAAAGKNHALKHHHLPKLNRVPEDASDETPDEPLEDRPAERKEIFEEKQREQLRDRRRSRLLPGKRFLTRPYNPRVLWRLVVPVLLLLVGFGMLPTILAHTPLVNWIINSRAADLNGSVRVGSVSLGWFSPVTVRQVEVCDAQHQPVLQVPELTTDARLAGILLHGGQPGKIRIQGPQLKVVFRNDGSNLEDLLARYLSAPGKPQKNSTPCNVEIVDGTVLVVDAAGNRNWQIDKLQLTADVAGQDTTVVKFNASGTIKGAAKAGPFSVSTELTRTASTGIASLPGPWNGQVTVSSDALPLAMFEPVLRRFAPVARLDGRLTTSLKGSWKFDAPPSLLFEGTTTADELRVAAKSMGTDQLRLHRLSTAWSLNWAAEQLQIKQATAECELGNVSLSATIPTRNFSTEKLLAALSRQPGQLKGQVDLAALAKMLPSTLRIRSQTQITAGQLKLTAENRAEAQGMSWQGQFEAADVQAVNEGKPVVWSQPITIAWNIHETAQGPQIDKLECQSSFLTIAAHGRREAMNVSSEFDLAQLTEPLGQLVDLGDLKLAGTGAAELAWKQTATQKFQAKLSVEAANCKIHVPGRRPWAEPNLELTATAAGQTDFTWRSRIDSAEIGVTAGTEEFHAQLTKPIVDLSQCDGLPVEVRSKGHTESWVQRLGAWYPIGDWQSSGVYDLTIRGTFSSSLIVLEQADFGITEFRLTEPIWKVNVNEPRVQVGASGRWDRALCRLELPKAQFQSTSLAAAVDKLIVAIPEKGPLSMTGTVGYQGDLARLQAWFLGPLAAHGWALAGTFVGQGTLQETGRVIGAALDTTISNFDLTNTRGKRLAEPQVRLRVRAGFSPRTGLLELQQCELTSALLAGNAAGKVVQETGRPAAELSGEVQYDLERLSQLLLPYLGDRLRFAGQGKAPIQLQGPLTLAEAQGNTTLSWTSANVYGFRVGPATFKADMGGGVVRTDPLNLTVNEGKVQLMPTLHLTPGPLLLTVDPGLVAQQIHLDAASCNSLLLYVAPALASVAHADGLFSVQLDGCRIPLGNPQAIEVDGKVILHSGQVTPGSLLQELSGAFGRVSPAQLLKETVVPFQVRQGRVYHQNMELTFPELTVRTSGSVGFDHTLSVLAQVTVVAAEAGKHPVANALRNQTFQVPIGGTTEHPQLDRGTVGQIGRQAVGGAVGNLLEGKSARPASNRYLIPQQ